LCHDIAQIFSGILVTRGTARGQVFATGERSALGRIGKSLEGINSERTPIQRETNRIVKRVAIVGLALAGALALAYWLSSGDWLHSLLAGLTLAMAILPEELPVVLTLFLSLGAWRLAREKVLARSIPAVELLGATTVLCVDTRSGRAGHQCPCRPIYLLHWQGCTITFPRRSNMEVFFIAYGDVEARPVVSVLR
jgi:Ca2+-transporting ATPase